MTENQKCLSPKPHNYIPVQWDKTYHALKVPYDYGRLLSQRKSPNKFFRIYEFEKGIVVEAPDVDWEYTAIHEYREGVNTSAQVTRMIKEWVSRWHAQDNYYSGHTQLSLTLSPESQERFNELIKHENNNKK